MKILSQELSDMKSDIIANIAAIPNNRIQTDVFRYVAEYFNLSESSFFRPQAIRAILLEAATHLRSNLGRQRRL